MDKKSSVSLDLYYPIMLYISIGDQRPQSLECNNEVEHIKILKHLKSLKDTNGLPVTYEVSMIYDERYLYVLDIDSINLDDLDTLKWFNCNFSEYNHIEVLNIKKGTIKYCTYDNSSNENDYEVFNITYPYNLYQISTNFYDAYQENSYYVVKDDKDLSRHLKQLRHTNVYLKGLTIIHKDMLYNMVSGGIQYDNDGHPYVILVKSSQQSPKYS